MIVTGDLVDAELSGKVIYTSFRKLPNQASASRTWFDTSMSPGYPSAQYYAAIPLNATALSYSVNKGIFNGGNVSPSKKYLRQISIYGGSANYHPSSWILCDYLMFYSFIDESTTDEQMLTTSIPLPRYPDGFGVNMMAVSLGARTGGQTFTVKYTNSDGVTGRVSKLTLQNTASVTGNIINSHTTNNDPNSYGPFIPLQDGDKGVRKIESVTMNGVDIGLFALVLVKVISSQSTYEITAFSEIDFLVDKSLVPEIKDDAYLNFLCLPVGSVSGNQFIGELKTVFI
jgi:hypothetical protein